MSTPQTPLHQPSIEFYRSYHYSRCAYVVKKSRDVAGVEALYDTALNNGLAAIVASAWPGDELSGKQVKAAKGLLDVLSEKAKNGSTTDPTEKLDRYRVRVVGISVDSAGVITLTVSRWSAVDEPKPSQIPHWDSYPPHDVVKIDTVTLRAAIEIVYPVRHGRLSKGELNISHVEALVALSEHPILGGFLNEEIDDQLLTEHARDAWLQGSAADYVTFLGDEEVARRIETADDYLPFDPKDRLTSEPLQECPVCWNDTMVCGSSDVFGMGIGAGTCVVCGYTRSAAIADDEAMNWKMQNLPED
ncbi:hypothetical protein SAMN04488074_109208 [Lentzea albidocapillata subsp. violacea]|uniref:Uncharacterized protein n=1 Tax=Lentzea albidocapillata subsp. violacea TaxID=128104 RepID=A0A1G9HYQ6_9PSEU|nr:hypothetical protein [Lentzea albidocapillata]SDL17955.1 hypothetical protein SAMN04488074_109208 [Lentzea albidocapillata subsp. violacea]